jgi:putative nucleotidyltransferase with HDIG domain
LKAWCGPLWVHNYPTVPLPLRPTLDERADAGRDPSAALSAPERHALTLIAEHARDQARLDHVWILARLPERPEGALVWLAHAQKEGAEDVPAAAVRAVALGAMRGGPRRFVRRTARLGGGVNVVAVETRADRIVSVVTSAPEGARLGPEIEAALADLADVAARMVTEEGRAMKAAPERGVAYGSGLANALALLKRPPILAESRARLEHALRPRYPALGDAASIIETDVGLALAVMAAANELPGRSRNGITSVPDALTALGPRAAMRAIAELPTLPAIGQPTGVGAALARLSAHAIATRSSADLVALALGYRARDELRLAAALHDIGKVVLATASADYLYALGDASVTPEERIAEERRRLAIDHAALGAIALQRLGIPKTLATIVERHHSPDAGGAAAIVRLADMLAHAAAGDAVDTSALMTAARRFGLQEDQLRGIAYDLPRARERREPGGEPSPLTPMQQKVLVGLADGKTYKQIAAGLSVSESTVRTHLHNIYGKLDVMDRAQAVLLAAERGWI